MKKHLLSFLSGCLTALLLVALGTSALAVSGQVIFNFANVALDGETKITAGTTITAANGQQVPSSILYTDEAGGKTNYLPIRAISELLGVEVDYDSATKTVLLVDQDAQTAVRAHTGSGSWTVLRSLMRARRMPHPTLRRRPGIPLGCRRGGALRRRRGGPAGPTTASPAARDG